MSFFLLFQEDGPNSRYCLPSEHREIQYGIPEQCDPEQGITAAVEVHDDWEEQSDEYAVVYEDAPTCMSQNAGKHQAAVRTLMTQPALQIVHHW